MYLGLSKGITPLQRLQDELRGRMPTDLTPISVQGIPSEIRPLLVALNTVMSRLDENLVAQRRFISDAAHQLKTPLTGLRMQTELALNEPEIGLMRERLQQVAISGERLSHLTQQLLSLARAEAGLSSREGLATVDLESIARQCTITWADRAIGKGVELAYEGADAPVPITGSALLITELLSNLIDNAIKYTPSGGQVTVRVRPEEYPALEVEDTGIGVPEEARSQVFERFYRVLGTGRDGSGLGLAIVKEIALMHRARVHLDAGTGGRGTRVRTTFRRPLP
jgi:two-component system sensor histidine kinase TctE